VADTELRLFLDCAMEGASLKTQAILTLTQAREARLLRGKQRCMSDTLAFKPPVPVEPNHPKNVPKVVPWVIGTTYFE